MFSPYLIPVDSIPEHFFYEQKPVKKMYKIYNDGGHYIATFYGKAKDETFLEASSSSFESKLSEEEKIGICRKVADKQRKENYCRELFLQGLNEGLRNGRDDRALTDYILREMQEKYPNVSPGYVERKILKFYKTLSLCRNVGFDDFSIEHNECEGVDILFDSLYNAAMQEGVKARDLAEYIKAGIVKLFPNYLLLDEYVADKLERKKRNLYSRKKRFRRKAFLNKWNYFTTITYDDKKHDENTFRTKLRKCLSNLHTRRGWRYMGVFERAPETGRVHFHALFYIPDGEFIGTITEKTDYSTAQGRMQTTHENDFFKKSFGRNDFEKLSEMELKHGQTLNYLLKYISKTGERIVYSRGIPTEIYRTVNDNDIVTEMKDFCTKYILFDDVITWEKDVMHYQYKQLSIIDFICNPPLGA